MTQNDQGLTAQFLERARKIAAETLEAQSLVNKQIIANAHTQNSKLAELTAGQLALNLRRSHSQYAIGFQDYPNAPSSEIFFFMDKDAENVEKIKIEPLPSGLIKMTDADGTVTHSNHGEIIEDVTKWIVENAPDEFKDFQMEGNPALTRTVERCVANAKEQERVWGIIPKNMARVGPIVEVYKLLEDKFKATDINFSGEVMHANIDDELEYESFAFCISLNMPNRGYGSRGVYTLSKFDISIDENGNANINGGYEYYDVNDAAARVIEQVAEEFPDVFITQLAQSQADHDAPSNDA